MTPPVPADRESLGEAVTTLWAEVRTDADNAGEDVYAAGSVGRARTDVTDAVGAALDVVAENLPGLLAAARAEGAAAERERIAADLRLVLDQHGIHGHARPGVWDDDNGPGKAGTRCQECAARERLRAWLRGSS